MGSRLRLLLRAAPSLFSPQYGKRNHNPLVPGRVPDPLASPLAHLVLLGLVQGGVRAVGRGDRCSSSLSRPNSCNSPVPGNHFPSPPIFSPKNNSSFLLTTLAASSADFASPNSVGLSGFRGCLLIPTPPSFYLTCDPSFLLQFFLWMKRQCLFILWMLYNEDPVVSSW